MKKRSVTNVKSTHTLVNTNVKKYKPRLMKRHITECNIQTSVRSGGPFYTGGSSKRRQPKGTWEYSELNLQTKIIEFLA